MKKVLLGIFAGISTFCLGTAQAVVVKAGKIELLSGTTFADDPRLGGIVIQDEIRPFVLEEGGANLLSGNLQERVFKSTLTETLVFAPHLRDMVQLSGLSVVTGIRYSGFKRFSTDVDFRTDGAGDVGAVSVERSADGDTLFFDYGMAGVLPPEETFFLSILTGAKSFARTGTIEITGYRSADRSGPQASVTIEGVAVPTPIPGAVVLMISGLAVLTGRRWVQR